jgi:hypothetical protein
MSRVDRDIDNLISSRSRQLAAENEQHHLEQAWAQSERQFRAAQRSQNQREWIWSRHQPTTLGSVHELLSLASPAEHRENGYEGGGE